MWKWKVLHDFRIEEKSMKALTNALDDVIKILYEIRVPEGILFNFHRCFAIFNKKEEE